MASIIPDWAPNLHPLIIHFPIALLVTAIGINLLMLIFKKIEWLQYSTAILFILGAISASAAYYTGRQAVSTVTLPPLANLVLSEHADLALITFTYFTIIAVFYILILWKSFKVKRQILYLVFLVEIGGMLLLFQTSEYGGELVYKYGVGTQKIKPDIKLEISDKETEQVQAQKIVYGNNGSWEWNSGVNAAVSIRKEFNWLEGDPDNVKITDQSGEQNELTVSIEPNRTTVLLTAGKDIESVQVDMSVKLDEFNGDVMIIHHIQDVNNYDFLSVNQSMMKLGRIVNGQWRILQEKPIKAEGWIDIRVVGNGKHLRGYLGDKLITHGHIKASNSGPAGIRISGDGKVYIKQIKVLSLQEDNASKTH